MPENLKSPPPSRSFEKILTGSWNAIKTPPEWLGKKTVDLYDKLRFPKLTPEEKKMEDKIHAMLQKHYKAVGWTETAVAAGVTTYVITKLYRKIRRGRRAQPISRTRHETPVQPDIDGDEKFIIGGLDTRMSQFDELPIPSKDLNALRRATDAAKDAVHKSADGHRKLEEITAKREDLKKLLNAFALIEKKFKGMGRDGLLDKQDVLRLFEISFSDDLQNNIRDGLFNRMLESLNNNPGAIKMINNTRNRKDQINVIDGWLNRARSELLKGGIRDLPEFLKAAKTPGAVEKDMNDYIRILYSWYKAAGLPGMDVLGIRLKDR